MTTGLPAVGRSRHYVQHLDNVAMWVAATLAIVSVELAVFRREDSDAVSAADPPAIIRVLVMVGTLLYWTVRLASGRIATVGDGA